MSDTKDQTDQVSNTTVQYSEAKEPVRLVETKTELEWTMTDHIK